MNHHQMPGSKPFLVTTFLALCSLLLSSCIAAPNRTEVSMSRLDAPNTELHIGSAPDNILDQKQAAADTANLNILAISDFHGHLVPRFRGGLATEMGAGAMSCYVKKRKEENPATFFVSSGDAIGSTPFFSSVLEDTPTLDVLNDMGLEVANVGNHELDKGWESFLSTVRGKKEGEGRAKFSYISSSVTIDPKNYEKIGADPLAKSVVIEKGGVRVGFVGALAMDTYKKVSPDLVRGLTFEDEVKSINEEATRLRAENKADVVIALSHVSLDAQDNFNYSVDAVVAGKTHELRLLSGPQRFGSVPVVITQPSHFGMYLSDISITYDKANRKLMDISADNISATKIWETCGKTPDPVVERKITEYQRKADIEGNKVIATIDNSFPRGDDRSQETALNNLLAQTFLYQANQLAVKKGQAPVADLGLMNAGGIRDSLNAGDVTYAEAYSVQPFENPLGIVELTGAELKQVLDSQWRRYHKDSNREIRNVLGISRNVQYFYNPVAETGKKIVGVTINGEELALEKKYRVVTNSFLLNEGDDFIGFGTASGKNKIDYITSTDLEALITYIQTFPSTAPSVQQSFITG